MKCLLKDIQELLKQDNQMGRDSGQGKPMNVGLRITTRLLVLETNGRMEFQPGDRDTETFGSLLGLSQMEIEGP